MEEEKFGFMFSYKYGKAFPEVVFHLNVDSSLADLVEQFELFLKASGFSFDGTLDFVDAEDQNAPDK